MAETDNQFASILADVERVLGNGRSKRGTAHRSASTHLAPVFSAFIPEPAEAVQVLNEISTL